jgi:alpha-mannosidase
VILDTVKRAEDSEDLILRIYEAHGCHCHAGVFTSLPFSNAKKNDLLERDLAKSGKLPIHSGCIPLELKPFEVVTLRLEKP